MNLGRRRAIGLGLGFCALPFAAKGQQRITAPTILIVSSMPAPGTAPITSTAFRRGLRQLGYVEGQTVTVDRYTAALSDLASQLGKRNIDLIFATGPTHVRAATQATRTIPIVALDLETDPIAAGFAHSFARPGSNLTGLFLDQPGLTGKWLELLREVAPGITLVGVLWDSTAGTAQLQAIQRAADNLGVRLRAIDLHGTSFEDAFGALGKLEARALVLLSSPRVMANRHQLAALAVNARLPTITLFHQFAAAGGLIAYGPDLAAMAERGAIFADKILKGHRPGDIPIELPARFELVINLGTARQLGVAIPPALLSRADQVIE